MFFRRKIFYILGMAQSFSCSGSAGARQARILFQTALGKVCINNPFFHVYIYSGR
jgi:hypothetical protein